MFSLAQRGNKMKHVVLIRVEVEAESFEEAYESIEEELLYHALTPISKVELISDNPTS